MRTNKIRLSPFRNSFGDTCSCLSQLEPKRKGWRETGRVILPHFSLWLVETGCLLILTFPLCSQDSELLTFNLSRHRSWWEEYGPGCLHEKAATAGLGTLHGQSVVVGPGCGMVHSYVEALHSGLQILLAVSVGSGTQAGFCFTWGRVRAFPSHRGTSFPPC